ncbi:MAG: PEP-CTERM sorting domain-containing protein [Betaproteobacteria bacterium]
MRAKSICVGAALLAGTLAALPAAQAAYLGPTPYLSFADSPFNGQPMFSWFHLEDFEDGALNTPGVSASAGGVLGPGALTDSVDGDDGAIDGAGTAGHSWFSNGSASSMTFTFSAAVLGALPTHVGIVWTDVGVVAPTNGFGPVTFEAFDATNASLGVMGPFAFGDGSAAGATAEDRFLGATDPGGISAVRITTTNSTDWEVDHLQYGLAPIPEPSAWMLLGAGLAGLCAQRRRITRRLGG